MTWTAVFAGRKIGELTTKGYLTSKHYKEVGLAEISSNPPVLRTGDKTQEFAGWLGKPAYRPIVSVSARHFVDPEGWSSSSPRSNDLSRLWPYFRKAAGDATNCNIDIKGNESATNWNYLQKDTVFVNAFSSRKGARLIGIRINPDLNKCDGPRGREWSTFWFFISTDKKVLPLSPVFRHPDSEYELVPIDVGDYDGDQKSEMIFWVSTYNEDGYVMFYDGFSRNIAFTWLYH